MRIHTVWRNIVCIHTVNTISSLIETGGWTVGQGDRFRCRSPWPTVKPPRQPNERSHVCIYRNLHDIEAPTGGEDP